MPDKPPEPEREKTQIVLRAAEVAKESEERRFKFHMSNLEAVERRDRRMHRLIVGVVSAIFSLIAFLVLMAFFGGEKQSGMALQILRESVRAFWSGSSLVLILLIVRSIFRRN